MVLLRLAYCFYYICVLNAKSMENQGANLVDWQLRKYGRYALLGISILTAQIALGGWTSSNYAAMSCVELPICQGDWLSDLSFEQLI